MELTAGGSLQALISPSSSATERRPRRRILRRRRPPHAPSTQPLAASKRAGVAMERRLLWLGDLRTYRGGGLRNINSSMTVIIVMLVTLLFFLRFFSI